MSSAPYNTCNYIHTRGTYCESPALRDQKFCYFHHRDHQRKRNFEEARSMKTSDHYSKSPEGRDELNPEIMESLEIPSLDDGASIQVAATNIVRAILSGHISEKRGGLALYGLQVAAGNLKRTNLRISQLETARIAAIDTNPIKPFMQFPEYYGRVPHSEQGERSDAAAKGGNEKGRDQIVVPHPSEMDVPYPSQASVPHPSLAEGAKGGNTQPETRSAKPETTSRVPHPSLAEGAKGGMSTATKKALVHVVLRKPATRARLVSALQNTIAQRNGNSKTRTSIRANP